LYLGSSSGTTVSHLSDLTDKNIIGVDIAPIVMREFVMLSELRKNVLPLLYDASKLSECNMLIGQKFEIIFEDIAQRNMVETFIDNFKIFAKKDGEGWLSLKTRSIDSTISPREVLDIARKKLKIQD
jgi:fibrillarin-like pre-rRNA processing protein